jgi:Zn-dependent M28 family amino/carboxypeptidase
VDADDEDDEECTVDGTHESVDTDCADDDTACPGADDDAVEIDALLLMRS